MRRSKISKFDFPFCTSRCWLVVLSGLVLLSVTVGCQSGGTESGGDPALAYTCRQAPNIRSANDPIYARLNLIRRERGRSPLFYDRDLSRAARTHVAELVQAGQLDHKNGPSERLRKKGLVRRYVAENLARFEHRASPRDYVVQYWKAGEPEFSNLISPRYVRVGFGLLASPSHCYAVLILTE